MYSPCARKPRGAPRFSRSRRGCGSSPDFCFARRMSHKGFGQQVPLTRLRWRLERLGRRPAGRARGGQSRRCPNCQPVRRCAPIGPVGVYATASAKSRSAARSLSLSRESRSGLSGRYIVSDRLEQLLEPREVFSQNGIAPSIGVYPSGSPLGLRAAAWLT